MQHAVVEMNILSCMQQKLMCKGVFYYRGYGGRVRIGMPRGTRGTHSPSPRPGYRNPSIVSFSRPCFNGELNLLAEVVGDIDTDTSS